MSGKTILFSSTIGDVSFPITPTNIDGMTIGAEMPADGTFVDISAEKIDASDTASLTGGLTSDGRRKTTPNIIAAAGATQGGAGAIAATKAVCIITATASTQGVRLPTAATGLRHELWCNPTVGSKVYPATNGKLGAASTNAAFALVKNTATVFLAQNTTQWLLAKGSA